MSAPVEIIVNGDRYQVPEGTPLAAALMRLGITVFRNSVEGEPRAPLCSMGTCFECRVTIGGRKHQRACLVPCTAGLTVQTGRE